MLMFVFETTQELIQNLVVANNIKSISSLEPDAKEMLFQLFSLIDLSFNWEFTSTKRKIFPTFDSTLNKLRIHFYLFLKTF